MVELTSGAIARLLDTPSGAVVAQTFILQVVSTVKLHDPEEQPDQRVLNCHKFFVTDGEDEAQVVILDNLSSMVATNLLTQYSVMEVTKCLVYQLAGEHEGDLTTTHIVIREANIIGKLRSKVGDSATAELSTTAEPPATAEPGAVLHFIPPPVCLISDLTIMGQSDKAIRACAMKKTEIKSWTKGGSKGRLFNVVLLDSSSVIGGTVYTELVDQLHSRFVVGKEYFVCKPVVHKPNKYTSTVNHRFAIGFGADTAVVPCPEQSSVLLGNFDFTPLASLRSLAYGDVVDVLCVVSRSSGIAMSSMPKLKHLSVRRNLMVVDNSGFQVHVTLWGDDATTFGAPVGSVVAFKGICVSSYGERSLSLPNLGLIFVNPNTPQAVTLHAWYNGRDLQDIFQSYDSSVDSTKDSSAQLMTIAQINSNVIAIKSTGKRFYLSATIASISLKDFDKPLHLSTNCNKHTRPEPEHCYNFSLQASDGKDTIRIQCTDPVGNELFRATASEMVKLQSADKAAFDRRVDRAVSKKCTFLCKACTVDISSGLTFILAINASLHA
ncbi:Replication factor A protein 1 [Coemansia sp. RSA 2424]|nr:Replication factor A protein 1 [Coemansia sp. RSA 2424]